MTARKSRSNGPTPSQQWRILNRRSSRGGTPRTPHLLIIDEHASFLLAITARLLEREANRRFSTHGSSVGQLRVLAQLWASDGQVQRDLCRRIVVEEATMTKTLNRMAAEGLLTRRKDRADLRQQRIFLTSKGRALRDVLVPEAMLANERMLKGLTAVQRRGLRTLLSRMIRNLWEDPFPGANGAQ